MLLDSMMPMKRIGDFVVNELPDFTQTPKSILSMISVEPLK